MKLVNREDGACGVSMALGSLSGHGAGWVKAHAGQGGEGELTMPSLSHAPALNRNAPISQPQAQGPKTISPKP